jgi:hypothetical protein
MAKPEEPCMGYLVGGCALSDLDCPFDISRQVAIDFMHAAEGIIMRLFVLFAGNRVANMARGFQEQKVHAHNAEINRHLKEWKLTQPQRDEVDRRWAAVQLPNGYGTKYVPFASGSTFTSADWFHLMVYAGRWIMDGILTGSKLDIWLRLCRVFEALSQNSVVNDPLINQALLTFVAETVALCEKLLPKTESTMKMHNLIHLVEAIVDLGPTHGYWLFRCV